LFTDDSDKQQFYLFAKTDNFQLRYGTLLRNFFDPALVASEDFRVGTWDFNKGLSVACKMRREGALTNTIG
jgi:hypothetical protein